MSGARPTGIREEIRQTRPFHSPSQEAAVAIMRTADDVRRHFTEVVRPFGLTLQQYNVLRILRGARPAPLPTLEIGERLIERTPGVTRLVDRLVEKDLVRRERSEEDRREVLCHVTDAGLELLDELDALIDVADEVVARELDADDVETLLSLLDRVRAAVRADAAGG